LVLSNDCSDRDKGLAYLELADERFKGIFDEKYHNELKEGGKVRLSIKATQAALVILAYENEPLLYAPSRLLKALLDIDENLSEWRFKHMMVCNYLLYC
jgi:tryptophan 2,3-dioxygenase